jgi:phosphoribosylformimino-5-aminoimidazole carboxamide ribotide isomerase
VIILPAIDIQEGKVVRLSQGKFDAVTQYSLNPADIAKEWARQGAQWIHVVDLDGAKKEKISNLKSIRQIAQSVSIPIQMGGGVRTLDDIQMLLDSGVDRVVLGTRVIQDQHFLTEIITKWQHNIAVSLDCSEGIVLEKGWTSSTKWKTLDFALHLQNLGVLCLIYTNVTRDGMLAGPNIPALKELCGAVSIPVIASGGISSLNDIKALKTLEGDGLIGAIIGKALYEKKFTLTDAIAVA